ncbi:CUE domain-containing protein 1 [Patella vulgata]|uniref:CUE domain-containing protein 1 n=1 Tax=Patella vulgata TaxID=6465 RepID=UPI0024A9051D|nr:CUE domain-containing protein 1 [Patella vulgata]
MADTENLSNPPSHDELRRNENDFSPGSIHERSSSVSTPRGRPTRQLDFHQAMSDFKTMFPNMDIEIIEAVLRANNGIVDATIDQLLTMSIDNETLEQTHVHWSPDMPSTHGSSHHHSHHHHHHHRHGHHGHREHGHSKSKSKRSSKQQQSEVNGTRLPVNLESPPSYSEAIQSPPLQAEPPRSRSHSNTPRKSGSKTQPTMLTTFRQATDSPSSSLLELDVDELALSNTELKTPITSTWSNPILTTNSTAPLWGSPATMPDLPDHVSWHSLRPPNKHTSASVCTKPPSYSKSTSKSASISSKSRMYRNWNPPMLGTLPDDFLRLSVAPPKPVVNSSMPLPKKSSSVRRSQSERHVRHHSQPARLFTTHEFSTDMLQEKMKENERRRRMTCHVPDPELAQYLADERLALMIQNSEFLQELRNNEDFMNTLESDRLNMSAFEPPLPSPIATGPTSDDEAKHVGYGEDHQTTLEAFPFSQQLPPRTDKDEELRTKLKHMGKASRKQFTALARRFTSIRRKKSPKQILKEQSAPSTANLLDSETDDGADGPIDHSSYDDPLVIEPLPSALGVRDVPNSRLV